MLNHEKDPRLSTAPAWAGSCVVARDEKERRVIRARDRAREVFSFSRSFIATVLAFMKRFVFSTRADLRKAGFKRTENLFALSEFGSRVLEFCFERYSGRARLAVIFFSFLVLKTASATPQVVRVDGSIFDAAGVPLTTSKDIQIQAYDAATGGSLLWTSSVYNTTITNGRFTVNMNAGTGSPSLSQRVGAAASGGALWFEVHYDTGTAGNGSMDSDQTVRPRIRAKGTMFALSAAQADALTGVTATSAELNTLAGVTSSIQTQLNAKASSSGSLNKTGDSMSGNLTLLSQGELRLGDADGTFNYVALRAPTGVTSNVTWTLPALTGISGQVLSTNGSGTLSWATASSGGSYTAGGTASHPSAGCPTGYIAVPGDTAFGTTDFCVMKYEAKSGAKGVESRAAGDPLRYTISQDTARSACRNLGPGYALINNAEWNTIAANIINQNGNWSSGTRGTGTVNRGHSDNSPGDALAASTDNDPCSGTGNASCTNGGSGDWTQKRTHTLSNSEVIWDFAGNVWEWVDLLVTSYKVNAQGAWITIAQTTPTTDMPISIIRPTSSTHAWWNDSWSSTQGLGDYYPGTNGSGGAALRGGDWNCGAYGGVLALYLNSAPSIVLQCRLPLRV